MAKFMCFLMIFPILLCSMQANMVDLFSEDYMIEIYKDGQLVEIDKDQFDKFEEIFCESIEGSRQMPAYGVSIHEHTIEAMKSGFWIKFIFDKVIVKSGMPFDSLLINVTKDCYGINIIRGLDGRYEGRCYYLDFDKTLDELYNFIDTLEIEKTESVSEFEPHFEEGEQTFESEGDENENKDNNDDGKLNPKNKVINQNPEELSKAQKSLLENLQ